MAEPSHGRARAHLIRASPVMVRNRAGNGPGLVAALGFAEDGGEIAACDGEALLDHSGDCEVSAATGDAESFAEDPHGSGAVVDLKSSGSERSEGVGDASGDGDFFAGEAAGIQVDLGDALARRASRQQQYG